MITVLLYLTAILYPVLSALQEAPVVRAMIDYAPVGHPYEKPFHAWGAVMTVAFCCLAGLAKGWAFGLQAALWYWFAFDITLNLLLGKRWYYTGTTAWLDRLLPGKLKAFLCLLTVGILELGIRFIWN